MLTFKYELYRKIIHILSIIFPLTYYLFDDYFFILITISTFITILIDIFKNNKPYINKYFNIFLGNVVRNYEKNNFMGATYMMLSFLIISLTFPKFIVITSMIILSLSDTCAALVGLTVGNVKILNNKTLEGSASFMILTVFILSFWSISSFEIILISFIITITEHITSAEYDNFSVPLVSSLLLYILL